MTIDQFTKSSAPITVIVNVANPVAIKLAKILLEQGSRLLIVDKLSVGKRKILGDLLSRDDCLFMDSESTFRNIEKFKKIDYIYYFLSQLTTGSTYPETYAENMEISKLDHREFIRESNRIDAYMKLAVSFDAAVTMVTSAYVSQFLEQIPEANLQIQKYAESLVLEYVERNNADARIVRLGELIGKEADTTSPTYLSRLVREVILRSRVNIFGDGMQQNYLIDTEDAVYALLKAAFSSEAKGRTYMAAYVHPFTSLSLAYQLLELTVEEKQVIFNEVLPSHENISKLKDMCLAPSANSLGWEPQVKLEQSLADTMESLSVQLEHPWKGVKQPEPEEGKTEAPKAAKQAQKKKVTGTGVNSFIYQMYETIIAKPILGLLTFTKKKNSKRTPAEKEKISRWVVGIVVAVLVIIVMTPYVHFGVTGLKMYQLVKNMRTDVAALDSTNFSHYSDELPTLMDGLVDDYRAVSYIQYLPGIGNTYLNAADLVYGGKSLADSVATSLKAAAPAMEIAKGFADVSPNSLAGQVSRDYHTEIEAIMAQQSAISQAVQDAKIGDARLQRASDVGLPSFFMKKILSVQTLSSEYSNGVTQLARVYDLIPYLLGYKERRTYLFMIQNETELRATGGWFTNYVLLGIENGQVRQLDVNDVYNVDGKITGLPAPADMKKALGVSTFKATLGNWNPEFAGTSHQLTTLLAQDGIYKPNDVTISITFQLVDDILNAIGPVQVDGLGEITAANLYDKVGLLHDQFVPGSQEKTQVVSQFMPKLLSAIATAPLEKKQAVLQVLGKAVDQKTIMVYSDNPALKNELLDVFNTYRVLNPVDDPLFVVDWNWGGNKANRFLKRATDVIIDEGAKKVTSTMLYTNSSQTDNYPEGKYVNAQRVYYPQELTYVQSSGYTTTPVVYKTDKGVPYVLAEMQVNKQETKAVTTEFTYKQLPTKLSLFKQSGMESEVVRVIITRAESSIIPVSVLQEQGFVLTGDKWVKTYVRDSDIVVRLTQ